MIVKMFHVKHWQLKWLINERIKRKPGRSLAEMFHVKHSCILESKIDNLNVFINIYFKHALNAIFKCKS